MGSEVHKITEINLEEIAEDRLAPITLQEDMDGGNIIDFKRSSRIVISDII